MLSEAARRGLARLADGNRRFVDSVAEAVGPDNLGGVLAAADPFAVVLGCADSRVVPEIIFGETLGQLFVVRVAGNVAGNAEVGSIEYAIATWSCPLLIVLGHTQCGAVAAALDPAPADGPPDLGRTAHLASLLVEVRANLGLAPGGGTAGDDDVRWRAAVKANLLSVAEALVRRSNVLAMRVVAGDLAVVPALYDVGTGIVEFLLPGDGRDPVGGPDSSRADVEAGDNSATRAPRIGGAQAVDTIVEAGTADNGAGADEAGPVDQEARGGGTWHPAGPRTPVPFTAHAVD